MFPTLTAFYAAILALIYVGLSGWVVAGRVSHRVLFGDAGNDALVRRVRTHGNFAEYVPFALVLIGFYEAGGGGTGVVRGLLIALVVARLMHPIGMFAPADTPKQYAFRGGAVVTTFLIMAVTAILLLIQAG